MRTSELNWNVRALTLFRIYVLVLSVHPLVAFVYNEGIARFATHKSAAAQRALLSVSLVA
jgi:hypothetical protein